MLVELHPSFTSECVQTLFFDKAAGRTRKKFGVWGWQSKLSHLEICSTNAGLQVSTLSGHCMTTGFGPFELSTYGLLQRGRDHSPAKGCFDLRNPALGYSAISIQ